MFRLNWKRGLLKSNKALRNANAVDSQDKGQAWRHFTKILVLYAEKNEKKYEHFSK